MLTVEPHWGQKTHSTLPPEAPLRTYVTLSPERRVTWFLLHRDVRANALPERL